MAKIRRFVTDADLDFMRVPHEFRTITWRAVEESDPVRQKIIKYLKLIEEESIQKNLGICFEGKSGSGKTHFACLTLRSLRAFGSVCFYVNATQAQEDCEMGYMMGDKTYRDFYKTVDVLLIDDVTLEFVSDKEPHHVIDILEHRKTNNLITLITISSIQAGFGKYGEGRFTKVLSSMAIMTLKGNFHKKALVENNKLLEGDV